ncbi:hypothetical protein RhiirB3_451498 [Rhizophagus irregularis]|nr:hypothetical protein RhiirB3_451498 [Rhizophagus irregularis]
MVLDGSLPVDGVFIFPVSKELESCCRHLNHIQKQLNEAQDSLHDSIQLRSQLEDDLTIARSKILDLEDELTKRRKEQRMLGKKYMELKEENYTIKTRQLRFHSTTPATPIPSQLTKSLWMILRQLFMTLAIAEYYKDDGKVLVICPVSVSFQFLGVAAFRIYRIRLRVRYIGFSFQLNRFLLVFRCWIYRFSTFDWPEYMISAFGYWALDLWVSAFCWVLDIWISAFSSWVLDIWVSTFGSWTLDGYQLRYLLGLWVGFHFGFLIFLWTSIEWVSLSNFCQIAE